jgi:archaellum component FlaC
MRAGNRKLGAERGTDAATGPPVNADIDNQVLDMLHAIRADLARLAEQVDGIGQQIGRVEAAVARLQQDHIARRLGETASR